jgi:hypothetical protein
LRIIFSSAAKRKDPQFKSFPHPLCYSPVSRKYVEWPPAEGALMGKASRHKKREPAQLMPKTERPSQLRWWMMAVVCLAAFLAFVQTLSFDFVFSDLR